MKHLPFVAILLVCSCKTDKTKEPNKTIQQLSPEMIAEVTTMPLKTVAFRHELISNGKISALTMAEVQFKTTEIIAQIFVKNGTHLAKGQRIAALDTYVLINKEQEAKDALERSELEMQNVLIGQGYHLDNLETIPAGVLELAKIKSGYNTAQIQYKMASYNLNQATLIAPIAGTVANLFSKPHTLSKPSEIFCNIIGTQSLEVSFTLLESELALTKVGDDIIVIPFSMPDEQIKGRVSEINPWVNENGIVQVKATVANHPQLVEGMNVRVKSLRPAGKYWVVPKTAVVLRTGKQVLFTLVNGKAFWNYVQTGLENTTEYTITSETLKEGDQVIVSGNTYLAHQSSVKVMGSKNKNKVNR